MQTLQHLSCAVCFSALLVVYIGKVVREWREFHPKQELGSDPSPHATVKLSA